MRERVLELSHDFWVNMGRPERDALKARLTAGEHDHDGHKYAVVKDAIPDDAVLSIPEKHPTHKTLLYYVLSDQFSDDDPSWLTPVGEMRHEA